MMSGRAYVLFALAAALATLFGCSPLENAGGSSGGEAFARVKGVVRDTAGAALSDALVVMRTARYGAEAGAQAAVYRDTSDAEGKFVFKGVTPGDYLLHASASARDIARALALHVDDGSETISVDSLTLDVAGTLACSVSKDYLPDTTPIILSVLGAQKEEKDAEGIFELSLAPGVYTIAAASAHDLARPAIIREVVVNPGEKTVIEGIGLPFQQHEDSLKVVQFMANQGIGADLFDNIVQVNLNRIRGLNLSRATIVSLHESIGSLSFLHSITIKESPGVTLPDTLGALPALSAFSCTYCQLDALPPALVRCTNLRTLSVNGNNLTSLPPDFGNLAGLREFNGSANAFSSVPAALFNCEKLQSLDLSGNRLDSLPSAIERLGSLQTLALSSNKLTSLPVSLGNCGQLVTLRLWSNSFTDFPAPILSLANCAHLRLQDNSITAIPENITALTSLRELLLSGNELTMLPAAITALANVTKVTVADNKLCAPEASVEQWLDRVAEASWRTSQRECE